MTGVDAREEEFIRETLAPVLGNPLDDEAIVDRILTVTGTDRYEYLTYRPFEKDGKVGLEIRARPKAYGPPFLLVSPELTNVSSSSFSVNLGGRVVAYDWVGTGSEVRMDGVVGTRRALGFEVWRPLGKIAALRGAARLLPADAAQRLRGRATRRRVPLHAGRRRARPGYRRRSPRGGPPRRGHRRRQGPDPHRVAAAARDRRHGEVQLAVVRLGQPDEPRRAEQGPLHQEPPALLLRGARADRRHHPDRQPAGVLAGRGHRILVHARQARGSVLRELRHRLVIRRSAARSTTSRSAARSASAPSTATNCAPATTCSAASAT